jgi:hypothetical protein
VSLFEISGREGRIMPDADDWSKTSANILGPEMLTEVRSVLEQQPIILEHRLYRASTAPLRLIFEEYEDFLVHLTFRANPGDHLLIWGYSDLCKNENRLVDGKYPDDAGRTPRGGAY